MEGLSDKIILLCGWRRYLLAAAAGALASLSQPPFDFFVVCFLSFPVLVWLIDGAVDDADASVLGRLRPPALVGWWFGFGYFVSGLWWVGSALLVDAENFAWALPLAILGLPALLACFYAFAVVLARLFWSDGIGRIFALAFGFGIAEWLRAFVLTGFPWNAIGYAAMPIPLLMQSAAVIGLYGMNALAVFVFATPALLAARRDRWTGLTIALVLVLIHVGFGYVRLSNATVADQGTRIRIVQPSIEQSMKWDAGARKEIFEKLVTLTETPVGVGERRPDIIVWPETSVPYILTETPDVLRRIADVLQTGQVLLAGAVRIEPTLSGDEIRYYNAIYAINDAGEIVGAADKVHLVPFGEYLPLESILKSIGVTEIVETPGGFSAAPMRRSLPVTDEIAALPLICYEAIFPAEMGYTGPDVDVIVNVTNDAWYGDTPGPYQHFRQAQLRSVELGLPLIRAANNGLSAVVDPYGRIVEGLSLNAVGVIDADVPKRVKSFWPGGVTSFHGFAIFLGLFVVALLCRRISRHRLGRML